MRRSLLALALLIATPAVADTGDTAEPVDTAGPEDTGTTSDSGVAEGAADLVGDPGGMPGCAHLALAPSMLGALLALAVVGRRRAT